MGSLLPCHHAARVVPGRVWRVDPQASVGWEPRQPKPPDEADTWAGLPGAGLSRVRANVTHVIVVFHSQGVIRLETQTMLDVPALVYYEPRIKAGRYLNPDILGLLFGPHNVSGRGGGSHSPGKSIQRSWKDPGVQATQAPAVSPHSTRSPASSLCLAGPCRGRGRHPPHRATQGSPRRPHGSRRPSSLLQVSPWLILPWPSGLNGRSDRCALSKPPKCDTLLVPGQVISLKTTEVFQM